MDDSRTARASFAGALALILLVLPAALAGGCRGDTQRIGDDFCHGVDDGARCDDGDSCTVDDRCGAGACVGRAVADGTLCDDGVACTVDDECRDGVCEGLDLCAEADTVGGDGGPTGGSGCAALARGATCDDADPCTIGDRCDEAGACAGAPLDCSALDATCAVGVCDPELAACVAQTRSDGSSCDDGDPCTVGESCQAGACGGAVFAPDGSPCDDDDDNTTGDRCASGLCAGAPQRCDEGCCDAEDGASCSDGDACTDGDVCASGRCVGAAKVLDCSDLDTACLVGRCDPATGGCALAAAPSGGPCDDGDACTQADSCQDGTCTGTAVDCSALDGACLVGVCEQATGACAIVSRADGMPCNDGDPCTGHDDCTAGICGGEVNLCGACAGKLPGAPCDDGDACSPGTGTCVQVAGGLRCEVGLQACSEPGVTCAVDACDPATGSCLLVPLHVGARCDDGDPCTTGDRCAEAGCVGAPRELCDAPAPDFCEPGAPNDAMGDAIPLAIEDARITVLAALDHPADTDWFSFPARAGQLIDVTTAPHCGSRVATALTLVRPSGAVTVAAGGDGGWASLSGARAEVDGSYLLGVSAIGDADAATYFLSVDTRDAPACVEDADCGCDNLGCGVGGAGVGTCVPTLPVATEPDDSVGAATPLALGERTLARLVSPTDRDWYRLELTGGSALDVRTTPGCDDIGGGAAVLDDALRLYASDGVSELAFARDDGAGASHAALSGFVVPEDGVYYLRVEGEAGATGSYVIEATVGGCSAEEPCQCSDQICDADAAGGVCVPRLTAPEGGPDAAPTALLLSQRVHAAIDAPYDVDAFGLTLGEGTYDISTLSFCGASLDTRLEVWTDDAGAEAELLAEDDDSGAARFAAVRGLTIAGARTLRVLVSAGGAGVGDYLITVRATTEAP